MSRALLALVLLVGCAAPPPPTPPPPPPPEPACSRCAERLSGRVIEWRTGLYHPACYDAVAPRCGVCAAVIRGKHVTLADEFAYHDRCAEKTPRCFGCNLPAAGIRGEGWRFEDGRALCSVCRAEAVTDERAAAQALSEARLALKLALGLDLGTIATPLVLVGRRELDALAGDLAHPSLKALTEVEEELAPPGERGRRRYRLAALSGLPRGALVGILAHELFHVLQSEASGEAREAAFREGSANWVQLAVLRARGDSLRLKLLERDKDPVYGEGLRRFERLVRARGERAAIEFALRARRFPEGF